MSDPLIADLRTSARWNRLVFGAVLAATLALAVLHYWQFWQDSRPRWNGLTHDRNGHYEFAQHMALALREADLHTFFSTLEKAKVWPPVHGLLAALVLAVGGLDYRLAVLPSLGGWIMTVAFGFLVARRISSGCGNAAGIIAAAMILASPAHRIYGTDIMLESLGAGLTMLTLYLSVVARQEHSTVAWRRMAIVLTVLFFEKYNYWLLVVAALGIAEILQWRKAEWIAFTGFFRRAGWQPWWRGPLRQSLNGIFILVAATAAAVFLVKPAPLQLGSHAVSLYPPNNLVTLAYAILFLRLMPEWKRIQAGPALRQILNWHCLPLAVSFLLPRRLSAFVWYVGPLNRGEQEKHTLREGLDFYYQALVTDYHVAAWSVVFTALLFLLALLTFRRWRAGGLAVLWLALLSAASVVAHPNQKSRFLHSWLPAAWVAGAAGLATCIDRAGRSRRPLAVLASAAVTLGHAPGMLERGHASETGCGGETTSLLDIPDAYLPSLAGLHRVAVFSTVPCDQFVIWTHRERYRRKDAIELPVRGHAWSPEIAPMTSADAVLFIDIADDPLRTLPPESDASAKFGKRMGEQEEFHLQQQWRLPEHGCTVSLWTRVSASAVARD
ncbi:MAG TPA: glycosyltransferase family 39 protein [Chthoniobacter sp.]|nr:glycosyltransferase family 39 protein [Chthoniobacter sp.]